MEQRTRKPRPYIYYDPATNEAYTVDQYKYYKSLDIHQGLIPLYKRPKEKNDATTH